MSTFDNEDDESSDKCAVRGGICFEHDLFIKHGP